MKGVFAAGSRVRLAAAITVTSRSAVRGMLAAAAARRGRVSWV